MGTTDTDSVRPRTNVRLKKLKEESRYKKMKKGKPATLCSLVSEPEYQGKFVAVSTGRQKRVIASANTYGALLKAVKKTAAHTLFSVVPVPKEGLIYSH